MKNQPEVWLRGPIDRYPPLLQPVAHAILQAQEEIQGCMAGFPGELLWERPAGLASPGFHLQHITGVLDRMATYAQGKALDEKQFRYLQQEGVKDNLLGTEVLLGNLADQIQTFLTLVSNTDPATLTEYRSVGRASLPSTVGGLLFHAAEHTQRHVGQLLVTVRVLVANQCHQAG